MNPATTTPSRVGRIRTVALAATIALSTLIPSLAAVQAQDTGFDVSVSSPTELSGLTAMVAGSDNGLRLRAEAAHDAEVLATLPDGTIVNLRIDVLDTVRDPDGTTRWWPVEVNGQEGWVSGFYLTASDGATASDGTESATPDVTSSTESAAPETTSTGDSFVFTGDSLAGATARVNGDGESVNLRAEPSSSAALVTTLSDGAVVNLRIDALDTVVEGGIRWWPITIDGMDGWIAGQYLTANDGTATDPTAPAGVFAAGSYVSTVTGDGDGVNLRAGASPSGALLQTLPEGTVLQVMEGPVSFENSENGWFKVTTGNVTGFIDGDLLQAASQPQSPTDSPTTALVAGDYAYVQTQSQAGARIRSGGSPEAERIGFVPESEVVEILSGPASFEASDRGWYEVSYNGTTGYVDGDLLVKTDPPVVETPVPAETPNADETPAVPDPNANFVAGEVVLTDSQTGVGVNIRVAPGVESERTGYLADNSSLEIVEGPSKDTTQADWYKVTNGLVEGWVAGEFLVRQNGQDTPAEQEQTARFISPLDDYIVTQEMGCSNLGYYSYNSAWGCNVHDGIDLATSAGTPLVASANGTVVFAGWCDCGLGYYVEIDHGDGIHTVYGHMQSQPYVSEGQQVSQGEVLGPLGSTGLSTGPHVHFMVRVNGTAVNPRDYVTFDD